MADDPDQLARDLADALKSQSIIVCYMKCWSCQFGHCPGGPHTWMDGEDIEFAKDIQRPTTPEEWDRLAAEKPCGCRCIKSAAEAGQ